MIRTPHKRLLIVIAASLLFCGYAAWLYFGDPEAGGYYPKCIFQLVTGLRCAGCGGQRAVHSLLHGDIVRALSYNCYALTFFPLFVTGYLFTPLSRKDWYVYLGLAVTVGYSVARNLPGMNF